MGEFEETISDVDLYTLYRNVLGMIGEEPQLTQPEFAQRIASMSNDRRAAYAAQFNKALRGPTESEENAQRVQLEYMMMGFPDPVLQPLMDAYEAYRRERDGA